MDSNDETFKSVFHRLNKSFIIFPFIIQNNTYSIAIFLTDKIYDSPIGLLEYVECDKILKITISENYNLKEFKKYSRDTYSDLSHEAQHIVRFIRKCKLKKYCNDNKKSEYFKQECEKQAFYTAIITRMVLYKKAGMSFNSALNSCTEFKRATKHYKQKDINKLLVKIDHAWNNF